MSPGGGRSRRRGVSLVELLVVVAIIGVFAAMAAPSYHRAIEQARADVAAGHLRAIWVAQRAWRLDRLEYTNLPTLADADLVDRALAAAVEPYSYSVTDADEAHFTARATRVGSAAWGGSFAIDETGTLGGAVTRAGGAEPIAPGFQFAEH